MTIRSLDKKDFQSWLILRRELWPECPKADHNSEMTMWSQNQNRFPVFGAFVDDELGGFLEASVGENINVPGMTCVFYIEGLYVSKTFRRRGISRKLIEAAGEAAKVRGMEALYSDTEITNVTSAFVHGKEGFIELVRSGSEIIFKKDLYKEA